MSKETRKNRLDCTQSAIQKGAVVEQELIAVQRSVQQEHSGPLPSPSTFEQYNAIVPGAAERILVMAEHNAQHAREIEKDLLYAELAVKNQSHIEAKRGQICGLVCVLSMAAVAVYALWRGYPIVAGIICSTTIIGLVTVFVSGKRLEVSHSTDKKQ